MSPHGTVSLPPVENKEEEAANTTMSLPPIGRSGYINQAFEKSVGDFQKLPKVSALDDCADVNVEGKLLDFDDVLPHIGEFGVYQKVLFLLMIPYAFFVAFVYFTQIFITVAPEEHWCWVPELAHLTQEQRLNLAIPQSAPSETDKSFIHSHCTRYDVNFTQLLEDGLDLTPDPSWPVIPCDKGWEFDFSEIPYASITAEMEWVCQNAALPSVAQAIFFCGAIVGGLIFGWMADRYGRISALTGTNVVGCIAGVGTAFVTNFWQFCVCRFLVGLAFDNCFTMMYILVLEYVGPKWRTFVANMSIAIFFTTATCMLPWIAYYLADWRMLCIVTSAPLALAILTPWALPESARWLVSQGRVTKAIGIMQKFERINGKKVDPQIYKDFSDSCTKLQAEEDADKNYSVIDLFRTPHLRKITILLILIWMAISLVFDGHVRNVGSLGLDLFLTFTVASATELPADTFLTVVLDRWGRRWLSFGTMVFSGLFSLAAAAVPSGVYSATLAILGRFCVNISYNIGLQYAAELLPTVVRAQGVAFIHIMGYVASIVAPFVVYLASISQTLPLIILGVLGIVGGALCLFLPETLDEELPQTLNDGENFGKDQQFWEFPCVGRKEIVEDVEEPPLPFKRADFSSLHHTGASLRASTRGELSSTLLQRSARASVRSVRSIRSVHSMKSDGSSTDRSNSVHTLTGLGGGGRASLRASTRGELSSSLLQRSSSIRRSVRSVRSLKSDEAGNECAIGATGSNAAPAIPKSVAMISHAKSISPLAAGVNHPIATSSLGAIHGASSKGISPLTIAPNASSVSSGGNTSGSTSPVPRPLSPLASGPGFPSSYRSGAKSLPPSNLESGAKTITQESIKTEDRDHT